VPDHAPHGTGRVQFKREAIETRPVIEVSMDGATMIDRSSVADFSVAWVFVDYKLSWQDYLICTGLIGQKVLTVDDFFGTK